ncbi:MAG: alkaline phosphatase family protein [Gammaproteobacteria bacterium]|nr:alkaline phosphatase family protein [Gammaproteobacteria bacterium]
MKVDVKKLLLISIIFFNASTLGQPSDKPALVVMIAVDQLRRDRLHADFPGGLGRLVSQGKVFSAAQLNHAVTTTCPGHAVMLTGTKPAKAGIPGNVYVHRQSWERRYCMEDDDAANRVFGGEANLSPRNLLVTTLGDWLKAADESTRVFSVGGKDRAVIPLAGHGADGVFWFDPSQGLFTSSRYYGDHLPDYIVEFNGTAPLQNGYVSTLPEYWEHPAGTLRKDDYPGEDNKFRSVSGHPLRTGDLEQTGRQMYVTPFLDSASLEVARKIIKLERLGQRESTDLLAIALSATDTVGHRYGPWSAESEDTLNNVDEKLGELLSFLDETVGVDNYVVALSSDHGVAELPEWSLENNRLHCPVESGRTSVYRFIVRSYWYLYKNFTFPFGNPANLVKYGDAGISVNALYAEKHGIDTNEVVMGLKSWLENQRSVKHAWTIKEIKEGNDDLARLYRNSYVKNKSGDLFVQVYPTCLTMEKGTGHGSPYDYDRNIPLIFYGKGIKPGVSDATAHSVDIATTLAGLLGVDSPVHVDGRRLKLD